MKISFTVVWMTDNLSEILHYHMDERGNINEILHYRLDEKGNINEILHYRSGWHKKNSPHIMWGEQNIIWFFRINYILIHTIIPLQVSGSSYLCPG